MVDPRRNPLSGLVEIDETRLHHQTRKDPAARGQGRSHDGKLLIAGVLEIVGQGPLAGPGRVRLAAIEDFSVKSLHGFMGANLAPKSTAKTDGWPAYPGAPEVTHEPHVVGAMAAHVVLSWVHRVFSNLKTWVLGVYHGLRAKHLQAYFDEFVFRFNRRRTRHAAFRSLLGIGARAKPVTYKMLISPKIGG